MTFCSEISGPSLQFIWILKAAGYSGHWLEAVNGVIFAVLFLFARVYVIGVVVWITFSELSDPFDLSSGPTNPFNSATAPVRPLPPPSPPPAPPRRGNGG